MSHQWDEKDVEARKDAGLPVFRRDSALVRAELVDALEQLAEIFREKASMEFSRAEAVEIMADKFRVGGVCDQSDVQQANEFARAMGLLEMRFNELKLRCERLIIEHGNN